MTVAPGVDWGTAGVLPDGAPVVASDRELGDLVRAARTSGTALPIVGLVGGSLWNAVGGPSAVGRLRGPDARHFPVDIVRVSLDDQTTWFVSSLIARSAGWRNVVAAMNTPWFGPYRFGHRAHPGDALVDVIEGRALGVADLARIRPRAVVGAYLPHPKLTERRIPEAAWQFERSRRIVIDGIRWGRARTVAFEVEPDALTVVV